MNDENSNIWLCELIEILGISSTWNLMDAKYLALWGYRVFGIWRIWDIRKWLNIWDFRYTEYLEFGEFQILQISEILDICN